MEEYMRGDYATTESLVQGERLVRTDQKRGESDRGKRPGEADRRDV